MGSSLPQLVRNAVDGMASEVTDELPHTTEGYIIVSPDQIQVIITKAALAGGAAVEAEVGESLALARELEEAFLET